METIFVTNENINLLKDFIVKIGKTQNSFRYFNTRSTDVIKNHLATLMFVDDNNHAIAYGHLDKENENVWLGICVSAQYNGMGYGNKMMAELITMGRKYNLNSILLTVNKTNTVAIKLYEKFQFRVIDELESYFKYKLEIL